MIVNRSQLAERKDHSSHHKHLVGRCCCFLIITTEASEVVKPCKSALHHPSFLSRNKLAAVVGMSYFDVNPEIMFGSFDKIPYISSVCINSLYPRESYDNKATRA